MILDHEFSICNRTVPVPGFNKHAKKKTYVYSFLDFTNSCFHTAAKLVDQSLYIQTENQHTYMNKLNKTEHNIVCFAYLYRFSRVCRVSNSRKQTTLFSSFPIFKDLSILTKISKFPCARASYCSEYTPFTAIVAGERFCT